MATVLFYYPFSRRARDVESVMFSLKKKGHQVISLNQIANTELDAYCRSNGIETHAYDLGTEGNLSVFIKHIRYFIKFCRTKQVDVVFSHLDLPNFIASVGQYFIKAKVFLCRHHINEAELYDYHKSWSYVITHKLARHIIVVSRQARTYMIEQERIDPQRIIHINLAYDFVLYQLPDENAVERIRKKFPAKVLLATICRLTKHKRPEISLKIVQRLKTEGVEVKLLLLGAGPLEPELREYISENNLADNIFLTGHVRNAMDYLAAADLLIHPSLLESSCVVLKEAGLLNKVVIACSGIGDVDDYIISGKNGFLVPADNFENRSLEIIRLYLKGNIDVAEIGNKLRTDVVRLYDIVNVEPQYEALINN